MQLLRYLCGSEHKCVLQICETQHGCQPNTPLLAHLLRQHVCRARQRRAHMPHSAQPLLLTDAILWCSEAEQQ